MNLARLVPHRSRTLVLVTALAIAGTLTTTATPAHAGGRSTPTTTTVAEGLAGPLGLAVDADDTLYVGESFAGLLTSIATDGTRSTLVDLQGQEVAGVAVSSNLTAAWVQTIYEEPSEPGGEPGVAVSASLRVRKADGRMRTVAQLLTYEQENNPDQDQVYGFEDLDPACAATLPPFLPESYTGLVDSHPYALARTSTGWVVADAAANAILDVTFSGRVTTLAVLPPVPQVVTAEAAMEFGLPECVGGSTFNGEPVPTDIEIGPDGKYYVTTLPGAPEAPGAGGVWRINPRNGSVRQVASGLSGAVDLAVARNGTIYVAELFADQVSTVSRSGKVKPYVSVPQPGAVEFGPSGRGPLYATSGVFGPGSVVRIDGGRHH